MTFKEEEIRKFTKQLSKNQELASIKLEKIQKSRKTKTDNTPNQKQKTLYNFKLSAILKNQTTI